MHATTWMKFENGLMEEDRKGHILYYCTYVKYPEYANPYTQSRLVFARRVWEWGLENDN